jgi:hypothetical protein
VLFQTATSVEAGTAVAQLPATFRAVVLFALVISPAWTDEAEAMAARRATTREPYLADERDAERGLDGDFIGWEKDMVVSMRGRGGGIGLGCAVEKFQ